MSMKSNYSLTRAEEAAQTAMRQIWGDEYSAIEEDPILLAAIEQIIVTAIETGGHVIEECIAAVSAAGMSVHRPHLVDAKALPSRMTRESQRARLLLAYYQGRKDGLGFTDEEAWQATSIPNRSCFWKRCGELRALGYIAPVRDASDRIITKKSSLGSECMVCEITPLGESEAYLLEHQG